LEHALPEEFAALVEQLRQLQDSLRPRAAITMDKLCFCQKISGYGKFVPFPDGHIFRAGDHGLPGEGMQIYVELSNVAHRPVGAEFETFLGAKLDICDFSGNRTPIPLKPAHPDRTQTLRQDYFLNFQFHLPPNLRPGCYTLLVEVADELVPADGPAGKKRTVSRSLAFEVTGPGERTRE
jgi:hypothetical protein